MTWFISILKISLQVLGKWWTEKHGVYKILNIGGKIYKTKFVIKRRHGKQSENSSRRLRWNIYGTYNRPSMLMYKIHNIIKNKMNNIIVISKEYEWAIHKQNMNVVNYQTGSTLPVFRKKQTMSRQFSPTKFFSKIW